MKYPTIKTDNYILITSDEEIQIGEVALSKLNQIILFSRYYDHKLYKKVIAHLPLNNSPILEGVSLLPQLPNEENFDKKLLTEEYEQALKRGGSEYAGGYCEGLFDGFEKAKEKYKFTEEDMIKAIDYCKHNRAFEYDFEKVMESLSQPKLPVGFKCEMERIEVNYRNGFLINTMSQPKIINGVMQGQWIFE